MKIKKNLFIGLMAVIGLISCSEDNLTSTGYVDDGKGILVSVSDGFSRPQTRAAYDGFPATIFEEGDAIGVYAFNGSSYVSSNVKFTRQADGSWIPEEKVVYNPDYTYYAYFPYRETTYTPSTSGTIDDIDTKFSAFINDGENKFWKANQSTKEDFTASNLMIAKGNVTGKRTVKFTMNHKRGMVAISDIEFLQSSNFTSNIPYYTNYNYYFLTKPNIGTTIADITFKVSAGKYVYLNPDTETDINAVKYLTFIPIEDSTFGFTKDGLSYSLDNGETWTELAANGTTPVIKAGQKILWKNNKQIIPQLHYGIGSFTSSKNFDVEGNIKSLFFGNTTTPSYCCQYLFKNTKVRKADNLILPISTISPYCYGYMFQNCTSLTTAPELPATTLAQDCYYAMFFGCSSLTKAPKLPATTLAQDCYYAMFSRCTALTTAPELPATTLTSYCYRDMFSGCSSLTEAPELPATTLADECYRSMFATCKSLTTAPELPATTVAQDCYWSMFSGCTSLTKAPELPATKLENYCYFEMFNGCTSLATAPKLPATKLKSQCYQSMFSGCTSLTKAPELPATELAYGCYQDMFKGCTSLTEAPSKLPATTLKESCYYEMFYGCTSLTEAPELPATELAQRCYYYMFLNCSSLTIAPELPATKLAYECYRYMFYGCKSLTTAPSILPATELVENCYTCMFDECTSLAKAPELPATTLVKGCYSHMFYGCEKLSYIKMAATDVSANSCTYNWLMNVAKTGTFVKNSAATWDVSGVSGIPEGWNVETYNP